MSEAASLHARYMHAICTPHLSCPGPPLPSRNRSRPDLWPAEAKSLANPKEPTYTSYTRVRVLNPASVLVGQKALSRKACSKPLTRKGRKNPPKHPKRAARYGEQISTRRRPVACNMVRFSHLWHSSGRSDCRRDRSVLQKARPGLCSLGMPGTVR